MSTKTETFQICDKCGKKITGRLIVHVCPCCSNEICTECQTKEDAYHKSSVKDPAERKVNTTGSMPVVELVIKQACDREDVDQSDIISTFTIKTGQGETPHELHLGAFGVSSFQLREGVAQLLMLAGLTLAEVDAAPDSQGKRDMLGILSQGEDRVTKLTDEDLAYLAIEQ